MFVRGMSALRSSFATSSHSSLRSFGTGLGWGGIGVTSQLLSGFQQENHLNRALAIGEAVMSLRDMGIRHQGRLRLPNGGGCSGAR